MMIPINVNDFAVLCLLAGHPELCERLLTKLQAPTPCPSCGSIDADDNGSRSDPLWCCNECGEQFPPHDPREQDEAQP